MIALLAALATAAYLYQLNIRQSASNVGAESPKQMKEAMENMARGLEARAEDRVRQLDQRILRQQP